MTTMSAPPPAFLRAVDALRYPVPVITELGEYVGGLGLDYIDPLADRNPGISIYDMAKAIVKM